MNANRTVKIACANKFHRRYTTINVTVDGYNYGVLATLRGDVRVWVSERQVKDARRRMCGVSGCLCECIGLPQPGWNTIRMNQIDGRCDVV